ncbi:hypothetical protein FOA52_015033 [Chlamydomonas sp. UWO 241]|nr:hypothetical protein FOA52_015033 [Chlamydomonas sp. UWO 241]
MTRSKARKHSAAAGALIARAATTTESPAQAQQIASLVDVVSLLVGDTSLRRSFVLSIPVARGANWFLAGGGRRMDEEEATAAAAERIAAAAEDGTSLPVRLATDVVRFLYGGTGRREPADRGVVSASLLNAKPAVGGIGVEPRGAIHIKPISKWFSGCQGTGCVEIAAYDPMTKMTAAVLSRDVAIAVLDYTDPTNVVEVTRIPIDGTPNSVAAYNVSSFQSSPVMVTPPPESVLVAGAAAMAMMTLCVIGLVGHSNGALASIATIIVMLLLMNLSGLHYGVALVLNILARAADNHNLIMLAVNAAGQAGYAASQAARGIATSLTTNPFFQPTLLARYLGAHNIDICGLQEVRHHGSGCHTLENGYHFIWSGGTAHTNGVGALLSPDTAMLLRASDAGFAAINDRILVLRFHPNGAIPMTAIVAYAPTEAADDGPAKDAFYEQLHDALTHTPAHHYILVMGDFNATTTAASSTTHPSVGRHACPTSHSPSSPFPPNSSLAAFRHKPSINDNGHRLLDLCSAHSLSITHSFFPNPPARAYTWYSRNRKDCNILDYILVRSSHLSSVHDPSRDEIEAAIKALKNTSPGSDAITAPLIKSGGPAVASALHDIIRSCWDTNTTPTSWRQAEICPLYKGASSGPNTLCKSYRYFAVACDAPVRTDRGFIAIYSFLNCNKDACPEITRSVTPAMPDMVYWRKDGTQLYAACEGEPSEQDNGDTGSDPTIGANPGGAFSITTINWEAGAIVGITRQKNIWVQHYLNKLSENQYAKLIKGGFRVDPRLGGKAHAGKDIEPEYIAVNDDETTAWVTLQENNAIMRINLREKGQGIFKIYPLGWSSLAERKADLSDRDGIPNLKNFDNVLMWRQPDTIRYLRMGDKHLLFIANEGDSKEEALRVKDIDVSMFDTTAFPNQTILTSDNELARLNMDPLNGLVGAYDLTKPWNEQGPYNKIIAYGARSWSIIDGMTGKFVYDSGDELINIILNDPNASKCWNCDRDENAPDSRSDNAGVEPEGMEVFDMAGCTYAAVGLERESGFVIYTVDNPMKPEFVTYYVDRDFDLTGDDTTNITKIGTLAPEMLHFISAEKSPNGKPLLMVTYEVSGQIVTYELSHGMPNDVIGASPEIPPILLYYNWRAMHKAAPVEG